MRKTISFIALAVIASQPLSQSVRTPIEPAEADTPISRVEVASEGARSAVLWKTPDFGLMLSWSDARGLSWQSVRVDEDTTQAVKYTNDSSIAIVGTTIYVGWEDTRFSQGKLFVNALNTSTGELMGELQLESPFLPAGEQLRNFQLSAGEYDGRSYLYAIRHSSPLGTTLGPEIHLSVMEDERGFAAPVRLSPSSEDFGPSGIRAGNVGIAARGRSVWVAWGDSRHTEDQGRDLFFNYSTEAGAPGSFLPADIMLSDPVGDPSGDVESEFTSIDAQADSVVVAWSESERDALFSSGGHDLMVRVSSDSGASFAPTNIVKDSPDHEQAHRPQVRFASNNNIVVSWEHTQLFCPPGPFFCGYIASRVSLDGGTTFLPEIRMSEKGLSAAFAPDMAVNSSLPDVVVSWAMIDESDGLFAFGPQARLSTDGGVSWGPVIEVESDPSGIGEADSSQSAVVFQTVTINDLYRNVIASWRVLGPEPKLTRIGGFRPQTLTPNGWLEGNATVNFDLSRFDPDSDPMSLILVSASPGNAMAPDRRNLGLLDDGLFGLSLQLLGSGLTSAVILPDGTGSTTEFPITLPAGLTLYAVGAGFDMSGGSVEVGSITDVVEIPIGVPGG